MFTQAKLFHKAGEGSGGGGGGDQHNLGYYETPEALRTAHPTATAGDFAIVNSTDTVWLWDADTSAWKDGDTKGQVTSVNNKTGAVTIGANDVLPSQTGNSGKFLTTDGTSPSWSDKPLVNTATGNQSLTVGGTAATGYNAVNTGYASSANSSSCAYGYNSQTTGVSAAAIGNGTRAVGYANALGNASQATSQGACAIAGGQATANCAYQLGIGINSTPHSFAVGGWFNNTQHEYQLLNLDDGTIPTDRLIKVNSTITLTAAGWSGGSQTVTVTGMTATGVVWVSPDPTDQAAYTSAGILCTAQAADSLTFTCSTTPTADIDVNVVML